MLMPNKKTQTRRSGRRRQPEWVHWPERDILDMRFCDLGLRIDGSILEPRIARLYDELDARDIRFKPHFWLGEEWFSPDTVPGVGIPFYLAHPRLMKLERKMMLEVEGGTDRWCMRLLRHETGHAIDTAYRLSRRERWKKQFGNARRKYPEFYRPRPYSKNYVLHLGLWYAQAHPSEDFAETFAVWVKPRSRWRKDYENWPAVRKLRYVDELMDEIAGKLAPVRSRKFVEPISTVRRTLREHYIEKRAHYAADSPRLHDRDLLRLFSNKPEYSRRPTAVSFLRKNRSELRDIVAFWTQQSPYTIHQVLREMTHRCKELNLRVHRPINETRRNALAMLAVQTINYLQSGRYRIAV